MRLATIRTTFMVAVLAASFTRALADDSPGAVYVASNAASGNGILVFNRGADGRLVPNGEVPTGGFGTGGGLGNQGGLVLDEAGRHLFAVNAGDDTVSVFGIRPDGLDLLSVTPAGGSLPVSVSVRDGLLYVLLAGDPNGIAGFSVTREGQLVSIPGSHWPLSAAMTGPAQISFSPDGRALLVTEKATNRIAVYPVLTDGAAGAPAFFPSVGATPFGIAFGLRGQLFVSEAFGGAPDASALTSYHLEDGSLETLDPSVATTETAACWTVVSRDGRYAYTTNTGSHSVSAYRIGFDGSLDLVDADGVAATSDAGPIDMALTVGGRYLYVLNGGGHSITGYRVGVDGSLEPSEGMGGLPPGANGLAAR